MIITPPQKKRGRGRRKNKKGYTDIAKYKNKKKSLTLRSQRANSYLKGGLCYNLYV